MRKRFVVGTDGKEREPTLGSWIVNVQNAVNVDGGGVRSVAVVWGRRLEGLGSGTRKRFVAVTGEKGREPTLKFWNVSVKPVRLPALSKNWTDGRFVVSAGNGFVAGLKRSESAKRQRSG